MKIAVIGYFSDKFYGSMCEWVANAWEDNGHNVERVDRHMISTLATSKAKLFLFVDCSEDYSNLISEVSEFIFEDQVMIFWSFDNHMPLGTERSVNIARECDLTFSMNYEHGVKLLNKFGIDSIWMPSTYSNRLVEMPVQEELDLDICMIGNPNSQQRVDLWDMINKNYKCATGVVKEMQSYVDYMKGCKIVINQPTEPWDIITGIRFFEALGFGKLCLQKVIKTKELEKLGFVAGEDFVYWNDFKDLKDKIDYYLENKEQRERIADNGWKKVQRMSMNAQAAKMEQIILSNFYHRL